MVAFYTALHLVERLAAWENIHHSKHPDRLDYLTRHKQHRVIHADFQTIFDASWLVTALSISLRKRIPETLLWTLLTNTSLPSKHTWIATSIRPRRTPHHRRRPAMCPESFMGGISQSDRGMVPTTN